MHTPKQLHSKAVFGRGQWSQQAWDRLNQGRSGRNRNGQETSTRARYWQWITPRSCTYMEKKVKNNTTILTIQNALIFFVLFWSISIQTVPNIEMEDKNPQKIQLFTVLYIEYFSSNFIHTWFWNSELAKYVFLIFWIYSKLMILRILFTMS